MNFLTGVTKYIKQNDLITKDEKRECRGLREDYRRLCNLACGGDLTLLEERGR